MAQSCRPAFVAAAAATPGLAAGQVPRGMRAEAREAQVTRRRAAPARIDTQPDSNGLAMRAGDRVLLPYRSTRIRGRVHGFDPGGLVWVVFTMPAGRECRTTFRPGELIVDPQLELPLEWGDA